MKTHLKKKQTQNSEAVANVISKKQNNNHAPLQLIDNRPQGTIQRKLEEISNDKVNTEPIQMVLKDPTKSDLNAQLTDEYHADEKAGDNLSINSQSVAVHQSAVTKYQSAKRKRKRAGKLHTDQDGGHLTAIGTLDDKINARREKIRGIQNQKNTGKKPKRPSLRF